MVMGHLCRLQLHHWRNVTAADVSLQPGITVFRGSNGQGKTNLLEAIFYIALLRSFRTQTVSELRQWGADSFTIRACFSDADPAYGLVLAVLQGKRRVLQINETPVERASSFINRFACVPLVPDDLEIVKGNASWRRRFLDIALVQCTPGYLSVLQSYRNALKQRNALLREARYPASALAAYDDVLVSRGTAVECARRQFVLALEDDVAKVAEGFSDSSGTPCCELSYVSPGVGREVGGGDPDAVSSALRAGLRRNLERDRREGHTSIGPHRGDLLLTRSGRLLHAYGSQGQCRLAALALRLAQLRRTSIAKPAGLKVVVLLDDVLGELDSLRRQRLMEVVSQVDQLVVACTDTPAEFAGKDLVTYDVCNGRVERT